MDWSDDVAYSVHDVEDGLHAGHIDPNLPARRAGARARSSRSPSAATCPPDTDPDELAEALDRLLDQEWWPHGYDGSAVAQARLKDATSQLIGRFCLAAEGATRERVRHRPAHPLRAPSWSSRASTRLECAVLKAVADRYVMQRAEQERLRAEQRVVIAELAEALIARAPDGLDPQFRALFDDGAPTTGPGSAPSSTRSPPSPTPRPARCTPGSRAAAEPTADHGPRHPAAGGRRDPRPTA